MFKVHFDMTAEVMMDWQVPKSQNVQARKERGLWVALQ
jgi:hypothetical protein